MKINEEIGNVEVRLMQRPKDKSIYLEVLVRSEVKPNCKFKGMFEKMKDGRKEAQKIGILAGALAEELCEKYSDTLDPSNIAHAALEAYREMMLDQKEFLIGYEEVRKEDIL